jgi:signal transduction histidine kinase/DNA-binding response OmpR family regulator
MTDTDKVNILVVDDLPDKLLVFQSILEELGENVVTAQSGREALRQMLDRDFAVVLLDVNMPDINGFETAAMIRQRKRSAHTPIIFITAFGDEMHTARGYSLGAVDYILSPVVPEVLRTKVHVFVDLFRMSEQVKRQADERVALAREQAARAAAEETTGRSIFLAEASTVLASSLDFDATLRGLTRLLVPFLGDVTVISLVDEYGRPGQTIRAWHDAAGTTHLETLSDHWALPAAWAAAIGQALANGRKSFVPDIGKKSAARSAAGDSKEADGPESRPGCEPTSAAILPLMARGRTLGVLSLGMGHSGRTYSEADIALAEDLAGRAAIALDNARLYRKVQEQDIRKNEFLAMLAHELRNPLAPIRNAVEILLQRGATGTDFQWLSGIMQRQVRQLARLVDDLLDVSRITQGKIELQKELVNVAQVVSCAVETSRPLIEARKHQLSVQMPAEPLYVQADQARLMQILGNLLNNAAKYTEEGGHISLTAEQQGHEAVFRVRDSGMGIPPEMLSSVFDLFTQLNPSSDRSQGGLGIGLTLVRRLVELHGGTVSAYSAGPGHGSEFVVRLPALGADSARPSPFTRNGSVRPVKTRQRVLLVDDHLDGAESLATLLRLRGHDVHVCHDGPAALAATDCFNPEVVLLDIGLPGMDGYQVARQMRQKQAPQKPLLVAITGYGGEDDQVRSREAGFDHHLVKPVDLSALDKVLADTESQQEGLS